MYLWCSIENTIGVWGVEVKTFREKILQGQAGKDIYHMTSQNYEIEGSCNFMNRTSSLYGPTMPSLVAIGLVVIEI